MNSERGNTSEVGVRSPLTLLETGVFAHYALLDSGAGRKLERFGKIVVDRPEPQALWRRGRPADLWARAHAVFDGDSEEGKGHWRVNGRMPDSWPVAIRTITVLCRLSSFRHLGLFPEQLPHWEWMLDFLGHARPMERRPRVLNLFAYTGAASLLAAAAGAEVTHVDASKKAIAWAQENQEASHLREAPIRWMLDDVRKFVAREVRRGKVFDVALIDPPKFGRGPDGEVWDVFAHLPELMQQVSDILAPRACVCLTAYAIRASASSLDGLLRDVLADRGGTFEAGELAIVEESGRRAISTSLFARWHAP